jgi:hypothetical protein
MSVIPLKADIHQRGLHVRLVPEADILQASNEDDERDARALAVCSSFNRRAKVDYLSFIKAIVSSRTSGFMKNVLSRGIMFTFTPSASSSAATIGPTAATAMRSKP